MNKRGFTLIELVAVILVIGVVAVITVPIVKDSIDNAKEKTLKKQTSSIIEGAKSWAIKNTDKLLDDGNSVLVRIATLKQEGYLENKTIADPVNKVEMDGCVDIKYNASYNQYEYEYKSSCKAANSIFTTATGSTSVPACITNNSECTAGTKVGVKVNASEKHDFYVMSEDANKGTITLIMDRNLGGTVKWGSSGPITALEALEDRTSSWTNIPLETYTLIDDNENGALYSPITRTARARLITYTELNSLSGTWLYENTGSSFGNYGYWTSTSYDIADFSQGSGGYYNYYNDDHYGVRPVITISKTAPVY